mgnify:FL=1
MRYEEICKAIRRYAQYAEASAKWFSDTGICNQYNSGYNSDFEDVICGYVDALNEIKKIRNINKRYCLVYDALGYLEFEIAEMLGVSRTAVYRNIKWLKRFFSKKLDDLTQ